MSLGAIELHHPISLPSCLPVAYICLFGYPIFADYARPDSIEPKLTHIWSSSVCPFVIPSFITFATPFMSVPTSCEIFRLDNNKCGPVHPIWGKWHSLPVNQADSISRRPPPEHLLLYPLTTSVGCSADVSCLRGTRQLIRLLFLKLRTSSSLIWASRDITWPPPEQTPPPRGRHRNVLNSLTAHCPL